MEDSSPERKLLREWERRCRTNIDTHAWAERHLDRLNTTCAIVSIGSLVALGVIAAGFDLTQGDARYLVVVLSVLAALSSVLLTVRDYGSKAAAHRTAARQYGALCREIEMLTLLKDMGEDEEISRMRELRRRWGWAADLAPNAPKRIREKAEREDREPRVV
jgi:hypothetical protein